MPHRMIWFLPAGMAAGMSGIPIARHLFHQGGRRHRAEAWFVVILTWFPLAAWLFNQFVDFSRWL